MFNAQYVSNVPKNTTNNIAHRSILKRKECVAEAIQNETMIVIRSWKAIRTSNAIYLNITFKTLYFNTYVYGKEKYSFISKVTFSTFSSTPTVVYEYYFRISVRKNHLNHYLHLHRWHWEYEPIALQKKRPGICFHFLISNSRWRGKESSSRYSELGFRLSELLIRLMNKALKDCSLTKNNKLSAGLNFELSTISLHILRPTYRQSTRFCLSLY